MPPHLKFRRDRNRWYIVDGKYYTSTKTNNEEHAKMLLDQYSRNRLGIAKVSSPTAQTMAMFKKYGAPDSVVTMRQIRFPCVYVFVRNGEIIYVGSSVNGFARVIASHHPMVTRVEDSDQIVFWAVDSENEAREMELKVIRELKPKFNCDGNRALKTKGYNQRRDQFPELRQMFQSVIRAELKKFKNAQ